MKKIVALMHKGRDATAMAQNILAKMGLARHNAGCRVGAADPEGMVKLAIGPIAHEATCEFIEDFLNIDPGVVEYFTTDMVNASELDTAVLPDLLPYVPPTDSVTPEVPKGAISEASLQATEPEAVSSPQADTTAQKFVRWLDAFEALGLNADAKVDHIFDLLGAKVEKLVRFPDESVLRLEIPKPEGS